MKESDAADERKIEPSLSSAGMGCGMLVKNGLKACACAVDLQVDCDGSQRDAV